jgi:hypothetical protein
MGIIKPISHLLLGAFGNDPMGDCVEGIYNVYVQHHPLRMYI